MLKELIVKLEFFVMNFMILEGEEYIVMVWVDLGKLLVWVKKVFMVYKVS